MSPPSLPLSPVPGLRYSALGNDLLIEAADGTLVAPGAAALLRPDVPEDTPSPANPRTVEALLTRGALTTGTPAAPPENVLLTIATLDVEAPGLPDALSTWGFESRYVNPKRHVPDLVVASDPLDPRLSVLNARALKSHTSWVLVVPEGEAYWFARFAPPASACYACLRARLCYNRPLRALSATPLAGAPAHLTLPVAHDLARRLALERHAGTPPPASWSRIVPLSGKSEDHPLDRLPLCPSCGAPTPPGPPSTWTAPLTTSDPARLLDPVTGIADHPRIIGKLGPVASAPDRRPSRNSSFGICTPLAVVGVRAKKPSNTRSGRSRNGCPATGTPGGG